MPLTEETKPSASKETRIIVYCPPVDFKRLCEEQRFNAAAKVLAGGVGAVAGQAAFDLFGMVPWGLQIVLSGVSQWVTEKMADGIFSCTPCSKESKENKTKKEKVLQYTCEIGAYTTWWGVTRYVDILGKFSAEELSFARASANAAVITLNQGFWEVTHAVSSYAFIKKQCDKNPEQKQSSEASEEKVNSNRCSTACKEIYSRLPTMRHFLRKTGGGIGFQLVGPQTLTSAAGKRDLWGSFAFNSGGEGVVALFFKVKDCVRPTQPRPSQQTPGPANSVNEPLLLTSDIDSTAYPASPSPAVRS